MNTRRIKMENWNGDEGQKRDEEQEKEEEKNLNKNTQKGKGRRWQVKWMNFRAKKGKE